ncbi:YraN family protein [Acidisoma sp. 7E03]
MSLAPRLSSASALPPSTAAQDRRGVAAVRAARGRRAQRAGLDGEGRVVTALRRDGWHIHGQRLRTPAGEVDIVAERDGLLTLVEVKSRPDLRSGMEAVSPRQQRRLMQAAAILQGENPDWGRRGMRFDVWLVDAAGGLHHVPDAFRDFG